MRKILLIGLLLGFQSLIASAFAADDGAYTLNPGDVLSITVWREAELTTEVLVRPDGRISFPLAGDMRAAGRTPEEVQAVIVTQLEKFIPDASVTVSVIGLNGNKVYVLGKVARPGEYVMNQKMDVMQALAVAGGLNQFASENKIKILRRQADGRQVSIAFRYGTVKEGNDLSTNVILHSGDVIVVP